MYMHGYTINIIVYIRKSQKCLPLIMERLFTIHSSAALRLVYSSLMDDEVMITRTIYFNSTHTVAPLTHLVMRKSQNINGKVVYYV